MARIVRHNDESVREGYIRNGGKEVKLFTSALKDFQCNNRIVMAQRKHLDVFYVVQLLNDWNVDVPSWKYPRNLESPRVSSPGFGNNSKMMRLLGQIGLYARSSVRCVPLTSTHCRLRSTWSREHALWRPQQWSCVMFSDESRFSLQSDSHWTLIWRSPGTRENQENAIERHRYGGAGWLVWGGIILGSRTDLHVQSVTMTGHIYRDVNLEQHVRLFRGAMGVEFLFMDDNARPHRANIVDECLHRRRLMWTNAIVDECHCRRIGGYHPCGLANILTRLESNRACVGFAWLTSCSPSTPPTCLPELRRALLDEWCNISQDQIDNLILSLPRRCKVCIASSGRHTPY
ncbi:transposable element Tcb1 transposase [Trichonephila clavipes]|uniref:Transposable element Tcb1 transposase n=1 Tax=Trichonephila clavipes TaxID=2585209 RepID=A0A8X6SX41_TRICX|nr:transposable element Tcb1 transposase [Trichonephila clavipes]